MSNITYTTTYNPKTFTLTTVGVNETDVSVRVETVWDNEEKAVVHYFETEKEHIKKIITLFATNTPGYKKTEFKRIRLGASSSLYVRTVTADNDDPNSVLFRFHDYSFKKEFPFITVEKQTYITPYYGYHIGRVRKIFLFDIGNKRTSSKHK